MASDQRDHRALAAIAEIDPTAAVAATAVIEGPVRIGANAVTSPGTLLPRRAVVPRLALVEQT